MTTKDYQRKSPLTIFLGYFKRHWKLFLVDMGCAVLIAAVDLAFPLVTRNALYNMLPNQLYGVFFTVMAVMAICYGLRSFLNYIVAYYGHTFGIRVEADIRADLFRHIQSLGFDFFDRNRTGQLMSRLTSDLFDLTELAHHGPEDLVTSTLTIIGALAVMGTIQWRLALVVGMMVPLLLIVAMLMRKNMSRVSKLVKQKTGHINTQIESSLSGVRTAKAFANENVENARFMAANDVYKGSKRQFHKAMGGFVSVMELFLCGLNVVVIGYGGYLTMKGQMDYRDLLTFTLYIGSFTAPMRKLAGFSELFANGFAGLNRFVEIMRTEPTLQDKPGALDLQDVQGQICVKNVSFAYDGDLDVLRDVSLEINAGESIAVVGPSGGGKTTLCQLIPRFYEVSSGSIAVDGIDIRQVTQKSLRESIGIVQQEVFFLPIPLWKISVTANRMPQMRKWWKRQKKPRYTRILCRCLTVLPLMWENGEPVFPADRSNGCPSPESS